MVSEDSAEGSGRASSTLTERQWSPDMSESSAQRSWMWVKKLTWWWSRIQSSTNGWKRGCGWECITRLDMEHN